MSLRSHVSHDHLVHHDADGEVPNVLVQYRPISADNILFSSRIQPKAFRQLGPWRSWRDGLQQ